MKRYLPDVLSSLVVFLVALPLCLGIAIAAGLPPAAGLGAGIIGGLVVGSLAGCPLQVTGPAAGLITIAWEIVQEHGVDGLGVAVALGGLIQAIFGVAGLGRWFRAAPPAVVKGMLSGIGVAIFASQFHVMFDLSPQASAVQNLLAIPKTLLSANKAAFVGALTVAVMVLWGSKRPRLLNSVPAPLVGVLAAIAVSRFGGFAIRYVEVPANIWGSFGLMTVEKAMGAFSLGIIGAAITIALVASAETLLTATAVDQMQDKTRTNYDKEVLAQGIGNMLSGFVGCLPLTGVIVRSAANVQAGAQSRVSTILHGTWLLLFVAFLPKLLAYIPIASLAGVLVYTGAKLMSPKTAKELAEVGKPELAVYLVTVLVIVATNLLNGIVAGLVVALLLQVKTLGKLSVSVDAPHDSHEARVTLAGSASFVNLPILSAKLEAVPVGRKVKLDSGKLKFRDHAASDLLANWRRSYERAGGKVLEPA